MGKRGKSVKADQNEKVAHKKLRRGDEEHPKRSLLSQSRGAPKNGGGREGGLPKRKMSITSMVSNSTSSTTKFRAPVTVAGSKNFAMVLFGADCAAAPPPAARPQRTGARAIEPRSLRPS